MMLRGLKARELGTVGFGMVNDLQERFQQNVLDSHIGAVNIVTNVR